MGFFSLVFEVGKHQICPAHLAGSGAPPPPPPTCHIFSLASIGPVLLGPWGKISTSTNTPTWLLRWLHNNYPNNLGLGLKSHKTRGGHPLFFPQSASTGPQFRKNSVFALRQSATFKKLAVLQRWCAIPLPLFITQCAATRSQFRYSSIPLPLFSLQSTATSLQFRYSTTAIFTVVHCMLQFSLFRSINISISVNPHYLIISSLLNIFKIGQRMQNSRIVELNLGSPLALVRYFYQSLVRYHFGSPLGSGPARTRKAVFPPLIISPL